MEIYVPNLQLEEVKKLLTAEGVAFEVTDNTFSLELAGKKAMDVTEVKATLVETDFPAYYDEDPPRELRAFRLPSGKKLLITDANANLERIVEPPPGWER